MNWDQVEQVAALVAVAALVVLLTFHGYRAALRQAAPADCVAQGIE